LCLIVFGAASAVVCTYFTVDSAILSFRKDSQRFQRNVICTSTMRELSRGRTLLNSFNCLQTSGDCRTKRKDYFCNSWKMSFGSIYHRLSIATNDRNSFSTSRFISSQEKIRQPPLTQNAVFYFGNPAGAGYLRYLSPIVSVRASTKCASRNE
jgi:hypothetical protein